MRQNFHFWIPINVFMYLNQEIISTNKWCISVSKWTLNYISVSIPHYQHFAYYANITITAKFLVTCNAFKVRPIITSHLIKVDILNLKVHCIFLSIFHLKHRSSINDVMYSLLNSHFLSISYIFSRHFWDKNSFSCLKAA